MLLQGQRLLIKWVIVYCYQITGTKVLIAAKKVVPSYKKHRKIIWDFDYQ